MIAQPVPPEAASPDTVAFRDLAPDRCRAFLQGQEGPSGLCCGRRVAGGGRYPAGGYFAGRPAGFVTPPPPRRTEHLRAKTGTPPATMPPLRRAPRRLRHPLPPLKDRALTSKDGHLDVDDAARALGAHPSRVLAALTSGAVPAEKVGRGRFRVAVADLDRLAVALGLGPRAASPDADTDEPG